MFFFQEIGLDYVLNEDKSSATSATPNSDNSQAETGSQTSKTKPEGTLEDHNRTCRGHIIRHLSEKLFDIYVNYDSAKEVWNNLKKRYGAEDEGKKQYVTSKWNSFQMKDDVPVLDQLHEYEAIVSKIQAEGLPIDEQLAALVLIDKLSPSWNDYRSKLKHEKKKMSLDELIADIMIEDANRKYLGKNTNARSFSNNANVVESSGEKNRYQSHKNHASKALKPSADFKKKMKCWNCNKTGHKKQDCRLPPQRKESNKALLTEDLIAVTTEVNAAIDVVEWIIDSGSTRHICSRKSLFKTIDETPRDSVLLGDDSALQVAGIGEVELKLSSGRVLTLTKVLFVPNMRRNLISSALLMIAGFKQTLDAGKLVITKNGGYVGKAFCNGNLFVLDVMNEISGSASAYFVCALDTWHGRLGHLNVSSIKRLKHANLISDNLEKNISKCEICVEAKHARKPFSHPIDRKSELLELIHSDLADFKSTPSRGGKHYYITFVDDFSRYTRVYLLRSKDEACEMFIQYKAEVENQLNRKIKRLRTDRGGEYESEILKSLCLKEGIIHEKTAPYTPQQNGIAERKNRTLKEMMNAMLISSGLPDQMWGEAVLSACYILNKVPHKRIPVTPYELWKGHSPNLNYLRVWGCLAKVGLPSFKKNNIGPKTVDAVFIGYASNSAAYRCLTFKPDSLQFDSITESRDVEFFENVFPFKRNLETGSSSNASAKRTLDNIDDNNEELRRSKRIRTKTDFGPDFITTFLAEYNEFSEEFVYAFLIEEDPKTFSEAMKSIDAVFWKEAVNVEFDSIMANHTFELVDLPRGCKVIRCKWILKKKLKADGTLDKFKARLVAQGNSQKQGVDYFDTYAPVTKIASIRILFALASIHKLVVHQMDVKTAFLNGDLHEEIYMMQPEGFIVPGQEHKVCKLIKSLYGLKQAPKQWFEKFSSTLHENGFVSNFGDTCVFSRMHEHGYVIICLYVDDMLILGTSLEIVCETKVLLSSKFDMKDLGEVDVILGIKVVKTDSGFSLNQSHYIEKILKKFGYWDETSAKSPYDSSLHLCKNRGESVNQSEYAKIMGSIMYLMNSTRPDIAYAVSRLSRYTHNPGSDHWIALGRLMRYLKGTLDWNLCYSGSPCVLEAYCDANWVSDNDEVNSTSGFVFTLGGGAVAWKSTKQSCIAHSTMESELIALELAGQEADWLRNLLADSPMIGRPCPSVSMRCDSQAAIAVAMNALYNGKKRHIRMRHKVIRSLIEAGVISLEFVRSGKNIADPLTKGLCGRMVLDTAKEMGLTPLSG